jgi:hypothetical protein
VIEMFIRGSVKCFVAGFSLPQITGNVQSVLSGRARGIPANGFDKIGYRRLFRGAGLAVAFPGLSNTFLQEGEH